MKELNMNNLRGTLEGMSTSQLDEMLHEELTKDPVDGNRIRMILRILEEKDEAEGEKSGITSGDSDGKQKNRILLRRNWWLRVASIAAIAGALLFTIPQEAEADNIFRRIARWTDSVFELINPSEDRIEDEYVFKTDHPGLQQVYDAVVELGVTEPVVPMWLPEGYELVGRKTTNTRTRSRVIADFRTGDTTMVLEVVFYHDNRSKTYYKDETAVEVFEMNGTSHNIIRNNDNWTVIWGGDNVEASITIDCQEDTLYEILKSIYTMEDK